MTAREPVRLSLADALDQAMALVQAGRLAEAERMAQAIRAAAPDAPEALNLSGIVARRRGDSDAAAAWYRQSLARRPDQPDTLNNLGNCLLALGARDQAIAAYREALMCAPAHVDAALNLALALIDGRDFAEAEAALAPALRQRPTDPRLLATAARCRAGADDHAAAIALFEQSLAARADHVPTIHGLALSLRATAQPARAAARLQQCLRLAPNQFECHLLLGHCRQDLGEADEAAAAYRAAIALDPTNRAAQDALSRLLWQAGDPRHLDAYRAALARAPGDPGLSVDLGKRLLLSGETGQALQLLSAAVAAHPDSTELRHWEARALWSSGAAETAIVRLTQLLNADPEDVASRHELARALIILDRLDEALPHLDRLRAADPGDQRAIALQAVALRLSGDPAADRLLDPALIQTRLLEPGDGDRTSFNAKLDAALTPLHRGRVHPLEQTLRGGTQTSDDLFAHDDPAIFAVRAMIEAAVADYVAALPHDRSHPFTARAVNGFRFSGSWSVRLRSQGYHENHVHPEGWISAVYYVALPDAVQLKRHGWLTFGRTALHLGAREQTLAEVQPKVGMLVLFPSYFYHGTLPFTDEGHRTTIAFDVVPRAG